MKLVLVLLAATALSAQTPPQTPTLTKEETLMLENISLRETILNQEFQKVRANFDAVKAQIEKEHPDYTLQEIGQGIQLVRRPPAPVVPKPTPAPQPKK